MPSNVPRHKVFISYYDDKNDRRYKDRFVDMMKGYIVDKSVHDDDIDDVNLSIETIRQRIRDNFISDATVTVVLIGSCTWQRKHVDWEISASLIERPNNPRCGLLGLILPNHPDFRMEPFNPHLIPPRLADNHSGAAPYALIHNWTGNPNEANKIRRWIDEAFRRRNRTPYPNNNRQQFRNNRRSDCAEGW